MLIWDYGVGGVGGEIPAPKRTVKMAVDDDIICRQKWGFQILPRLAESMIGCTKGLIIFSKIEN